MRRRDSEKGIPSKSREGWARTQPIGKYGMISFPALNVGRLLRKLNSSLAPTTRVVKQVANKSSRCNQYRCLGGGPSGFGSGWWYSIVEECVGGTISDMPIHGSVAAGPCL
jgi:hypothetical protein